ncbi:Glyoxalase/Bleomycin resistance protein/Dihydroxybiphenyl dioxygenase [Corynascus novoguineensis]|uniref:Glyoxalase/Bleomycin resistance protein/Dihydroxybiphenyl dioxygenase n=1 Tax=Corynascus novoguineensis TaxID=1126955 RepID=A0AAN7CPV2_9PEZI|nr:Glyoxalase/Bleomycin resistance protein/Dihydroxybiphenyl dioxygenase [Corynascus novoguineensis]
MSFNKLKLTTCLWFDSQAEEAAIFYTSIFPDSKIVRTQRYPAVGQETHGRDAGSVMVVEFFICDDHHFVGLNGGPHVQFNDAVSFQIDCANQDEVDYYWARLSEDADPDRLECGWIIDKFGVRWQVVPTVLKDMLSSEDKEAAGRAMLAMMKMKKMDIATLEQAFEG